MDWLVKELRAVGVKVTRVLIVCWVLYSTFLMVATCAAGYAYGRGSPLKALLVGMGGGVLALLPVALLLLLPRRDRQ